MLLGFAASCGFSPSYASSPLANGLERASDFQLSPQGNLKRHQIEFLNRIRNSDPERRTIERAIFNDKNELGLILSRGVELDKIPALMRSMLGSCATGLLRSP